MRKPELTSVKSDAGADHAVVAPLLTWYANGTLAPLEARRVEAHLAVCAACRADEHGDRSLARLMRESPSVELAPQAGLASVMERIDRREARRSLWSWPLRQLRGNGSLRPLALAVGAQAMVIVMLTGVLWVKLSPATAVAPAPAEYRTLSSPATATPAGATLHRLVLADEMSLGELREALSPWHSRIVTGPEGRGIYTIAIEGDAERALEALRATPGVRMAERVSGP